MLRGQPHGMRRVVWGTALLLARLGVAGASVSGHPWRFGLTDTVALVSPVGGATSEGAVSIEQLPPVEVVPACSSTFNATDFLVSCPAMCPFEGKVVNSENRTYNGGCRFQCVSADHCGQPPLDAIAPIAAPKRGFCRACFVVHCEVCASGDSRLCKRCKDGYTKSTDGQQCYNPHVAAIYLLAGFAVCVVVFFTLWLLQLSCRPMSNPSGLEEGFSYRRRCGLLMPSTSEQQYPLSTNLLTTSVGGVGTVLMFNFNLAMIVFGGVLAIVWLISRWMTGGKDLDKVNLSVNTKPSDFCVLLTNATEMQRVSEQGEVNMILFAYVSCFIGSVALSTFLARRFRALARTETQSDYMAFCRGLPEVSGVEFLETHLKTFFSTTLGHGSVVGVSVCWDYADREIEINDAVDSDIMDREITWHVWRRACGMSMESLTSLAGSTFLSCAGAEIELADVHSQAARTILTVADATTRFGTGAYTRRTRRCCKKVDRFFRRVDIMFGFRRPHQRSARVLWRNARLRVRTLLALGGSGKNKVFPCCNLRDMVSSLKCSGNAFVVFVTEEARDAAVKCSQDAGGFDFNGHRITLEARIAEPSEVNWRCFQANYFNRRISRLTGGLITMVWGFFFYVTVVYYPYRQLVTNWDYSAKDNPSFVIELMYTFVVVGGNQLMYFLSSVTAEWIGFKFSDDTQLAYNVLYNAAIILQFLVDFFLSYQILYLKIKNLGAEDAYRVVDETYSVPMMRELGSQFTAYCFPSTFLLPFLVEPIFLYILPFYLQKKLVGSHRWVRRRQAERKLSFIFPMDMTRYGDTLLNVILICFGFFFPGEYWLYILGTFAMSQLYIILYDHYRVLRCVPAFNVSSNKIQRMMDYAMSLPVGLILSAYVFRRQFLFHKDENPQVVLLTCFFFLCAHIAAHSLLVYKLVPWFASAVKHRKTSRTYSEVTKDSPESWFTCNPVYCLRSKHLYCHRPPCQFFVHGKAHLMQANEVACAFYDANTGEGQELPEVGRSDIFEYCCAVPVDLGGELDWNQPSSSREREK